MNPSCRQIALHDKVFDFILMLNMTNRHIILTLFKKRCRRKDSIPLPPAYHSYPLANSAVEAVESEEVNVKYKTTKPDHMVNAHN